ncbi:MAG: hypothetical protein HGA45_06815 [Chloroflexales bacterium]|nr:hypothetical protein [Chloroflexales bacterium]
MLYHTAREAAGMTGYSWEQLCEDYALMLRLMIFDPVHDVVVGRVGELLANKMLCLVPAYLQWCVGDDDLVPVLGRQGARQAKRRGCARSERAMKPHPLPDLRSAFDALDRPRRRAVQLALCRHALGVWEAYLQREGPNRVHRLGGQHRPQRRRRSAARRAGERRGGR